MRTIIRSLAACAALAVAIFVATVGDARAACSWAAPGANRFTGDPVQAVLSYTFIPEGIRRELAKMVAERTWSEQVEITRDSIGGGRYLNMRDMHWGAGQRCTGAVDRRAWDPGRVERGLIYSHKGWNIIVPSVCGNVALVTKVGVQPQMADDPPAGKGFKLRPLGAPAIGKEVPEPGSLVLVVVAIAGLAAFSLRRRR